MHSQLAQEPTIIEESNVNQSVDLDDETQSNIVKPETLGETLIWINFRYYAVPIFYFVLLGISGVVLYSTLLYLVEFKGIKQGDALKKCDAHNKKRLRALVGMVILAAISLG